MSGATIIAQIFMSLTPKEMTAERKTIFSLVIKMLSICSYILCITAKGKYELHIWCYDILSVALTTISNSSWYFSTH